METGEPLNVGWRNGVPKRFAAYHAADRNFFLLFLVLCWLGVIGGFMPSVTKRFAGNADYAAPLVLQVHVFAVTAWLLVLGMQMALIRWRRPAVHKQLGLAAIILIPIMAVTALWSEIYSQQFYFDHPPNSQAFHCADRKRDRFHHFGLRSHRLTKGRKYPQAAYPARDDSHRRNCLQPVVG